MQRDCTPGESQGLDRARGLPARWTPGELAGQAKQEGEEEADGFLGTVRKSGWPKTSVQVHRG